MVQCLKRNHAGSYSREDTMNNEVVYKKLLTDLKDRLGCTFCNDGIFAEMNLDLADYQEKTSPIHGVEFDFYHGNTEILRQNVALVDDEWVQYFGEQTPVFCGFAEGKILSFCIVDENLFFTDEGIRIGSIGCVGTVPQYRNSGIGLRMVDLATLYLKEKGCNKSYVSYTHIDKWYAKLGYRTFARFSL